MYKLLTLVFAICFFHLVAIATEVTPPYVWQTDALASSINSIDLKNSSGAPFTNGGTAYSVAISSSGYIYIAGSGNSNSSELPYLWKNSPGNTLVNGIELKNSSGSSFTNGSAASVIISSNGSTYIVGYGGADSLTIKPYLWTDSNSRALTTGIELKDPTGNSFVVGATNSVIISSSGSIYIVGFGGASFSTIKPYLWTNSNGHALTNGIALTDTNGISFGYGTAYNAIISSGGFVYIVGQGGTSTGDYQPYLWTDSNSHTLTTGIKLTDGNNTAFTTGSANNAAISSSGSVYIAGRGDSKPYFWTNSNDFTLTNRIELKDSNESSFTTAGDAPSVAVFKDTIYIVGYGSSGAAHPYLWTNNSSNTLTKGIELKNSSGTTFINGGNALSVAVSSSNQVYIVGNGASISNTEPYLWTNSPGNTLLNGIELKNSSGSSFANGSTYKVILYTEGSPADVLISSVIQNGNLVPLKGIRKQKQAPLQIYIVGGNGPLG